LGDKRSGMRFTDKALYRTAMGYAKSGGSIVNGIMLVEKLLRLIERLKETKGMSIFKFNLRGDLRKWLRCSRKKKEEKSSHGLFS